MNPIEAAFVKELPFFVSVGCTKSYNNCSISFDVRICD